MRKAVLISVWGLLLLSNANWASGQKNHKVELGLGHFQFYNVEWQNKTDFINLPSLAYSYQLKPNWNIELSFCTAPSSVIGIPHIFDRKNLSTSVPNLIIQNKFGYESIGKLAGRSTADYFDLVAGYKLFEWEKHSLRANLGLGFVSSLNIYLDNYYFDPDHLHSYPETSARREWNFGGIAGVKYDYTFWKYRINTGVYFRTRVYGGSYPFQINYGLHMGYNF